MYISDSLCKFWIFLAPAGMQRIERARIKYKRGVLKIVSAVNTIFRSPTIKFGFSSLYRSLWQRDLIPICIKNVHRIQSLWKKKKKTDYSRNSFSLTISTERELWRILNIFSIYCHPLGNIALGSHLARSTF